ncbi:MAG: SGNH/GDSL hydrolase family protein [Deltaproteobacteria bacterium]|nr:SGNH/GDSL hydrolase family protein [Deltaproteobacteria bacterium]
MPNPEKLSVRGKITHLFINLLLVIFSLCIVLVIAEISLPLLKIRTIEEAVYQARRPVVQGIYGAYHPQLYYTLQKNLRNIHLFYPGQLDYMLDTNDNGFRGLNWDLSARRKNVVILGDSFAFGWGVQWDQTVGKLLEKKLQEKDPAYQVINLAMPGWDIDTIIRSFELYKEALKPVAVVYVFCPNDLLANINKISENEYDIAYHPKPDAENNYKAMVARQQPGYWSWNKFYRSSYCKAYHARIIRPTFSKRIRASLSIDKAPAGFDFLPPLDPPAENTLDKDHQQFALYCLNRLLKDAGTSRLYLIDTSDKSILYRKDTADNRRWLLREFSEKNKQAVSFIDFESFVRKTPDGRKFYLDYDDHWSAAGHASAADMMWKEMSEKI